MIPILPRSGNYLEDQKDDELEEERHEDKIDEAEYIMEDR